jgi:NAD(P)-dependent dehydrogenase (short-subunit alcohol dehydrogenase family)
VVSPDSFDRSVQTDVRAEPARPESGVASERFDLFRLDGRVAFVTGGGGGLAEGICTALAAAGAQVACADVELARAEHVAGLVSDGGGTALPLQVDITDRASVEAGVQRVTDELGGIDILVNNAAIYPRKPWTELSEDEWDGVLAVNLKGYFLCSRACYDSLKESGHGAIVSVSSITFITGFSFLLPYVSSKGAVIGFTRALAKEVGPEGVRVNAIAPGAFPTDAERIHPNQEQYNEWIMEQQSLKRRGTPADVGNLVVFLASDAASFITGQTVVVDGGWAMH